MARAAMALNMLEESAMTKIKTWLWTAAALTATGLLSDAWAGVLPPPTNVPEPASMALLATGLASVALAKFRRRK